MYFIDGIKMSPMNINRLSPIAKNRMMEQYQ